MQGRVTIRAAAVQFRATSFLWLEAASSLARSRIVGLVSCLVVRSLERLAFDGGGSTGLVYSGQERDVLLSTSARYRHMRRRREYLHFQLALGRLGAYAYGSWHTLNNRNGLGMGIPRYYPFIDRLEITNTKTKMTSGFLLGTARYKYLPCCCCRDISIAQLSVEHSRYIEASGYLRVCTIL